jgi:hypothetical protein
MASLTDTLDEQVMQDIFTWANERYQDTGLTFETREETIRAYWVEHGIEVED